MAIVFAACGNAASEPTEVPPTATPAPTSTPSIGIITESPETDFDAFLSQIPEADLACFNAKLGEDRMKSLALGEIETTDEEDAAIQGCFSNEFVVGFLAGQIQRELGVFSGSSAACAASLLDDIPAGVLTELMIDGDDDASHEAQIAIQGFTECLTQEELAALAASNTDDDNAASGSDTKRYSSPAEQCMVVELGQSFADGYGELLGGGLLLGFSNAIATCGIDIDVEGMIARLEDTERKYTIADLVAVGFKKSKTYDVKELAEASSAHYGFYGIDPYNRLDYEARFYFSHASAKSAGVEFANHATGAGASLYEDDQTWTEGLTERRRCDSNGGHHVGRCGFPKYFDYVVAGNMVLMCQGKETLESLSACADLLRVIE
ncbi:MAG: hypothetical protein HOF01_07050 [Chloroflexi bacterium]|nr:hypothetical protein [Chloroflexota bacterium]